MANQRHGREPSFKAVTFAFLACILGTPLGALGFGGHGSPGDVCASVNAALVVSHPRTKKPTNFGDIHSCLCVSGVNNFVDSNPTARSAAGLVGKQAVVNMVIELIYKSPSHKTCFYPSLSVPLCTPQDPCSFSCAPGFTPHPPSHPTSCKPVPPPTPPKPIPECKYPMKLCNGVCGWWKSCPSKRAEIDDIPGKGRRDLGKTVQLEYDLEDSRVKPKEKNDWELLCAAEGKQTCGVYGGSRRAWECVDTKNDLESCGGCMIPHPFLTPALQTPGQDCTAIPGVADVACVEGACRVNRCARGCEVSVDGLECICGETSENEWAVRLKSGWGPASAQKLKGQV